MTPTEATEQQLDETVEESFPASDPPAHTGMTGVAPTREHDDRSASHKRDEEARPKGHPTSDRHASETAHTWEDQEAPPAPE